jgi:hypothetical protein
MAADLRNGPPKRGRACLAVWNGWDAVRRAVDSTTYSRARIWAGTFAMEQLVRAVLDDSGPEEMVVRVKRVSKWIDTDGLD